ncbi:hypothetical protein CDAR_17731 [Caerostris darwini]|uniref:Uncharacterized protein n=1 Tax=Caerostris darwini TaxID=1538125 RepID=A0AAV4MC20_9ARAC|nr:hypothetical protein CDAR_17731 [Caerostris darwini]
MSSEDEAPHTSASEMEFPRHAHFRAGREDLLHDIREPLARETANKLKARAENELLEDTEVNFKEEIESQPDKNAATGAVPQENCGQAMQNFPGKQMEILDTLTTDGSESKRMTDESLSDRDDYESKFNVFRKRSSEYHNEVNSNQHVKRKKIEILNSKESDDNQASIDNCSILNTGNNSDTNEADLKLLKKTEKFIIESNTGQVLSEFPSTTIYAKPDGKNTLLKIQILNATIYLDSGRKSICENAPVLKITETRLMDCDPSNSSSIRHDHALYTKNNTNFSVNVTVLENKRDENENISGMFKMKHQKNAPDVLMEKDLSLDHLFGANVKTHFDHKCRNENVIQHTMQNVEGNKDSNTVDFDCNRQCYKQVYQEMRNHNDLQNIMHNESKKREIRKWDTEKDSIEKYRNVKNSNTLPNTEITAPQELKSKLSLESLCQAVEQNSHPNSLLYIPNSEGKELEANNFVQGSNTQSDNEKNIFCVDSEDSDSSDRFQNLAVKQGKPALNQQNNSTEVKKRSFQGGVLPVKPEEDLVPLTIQEQYAIFLQDLSDSPVNPSILEKYSIPDYSTPFSDSKIDES